MVKILEISENGERWSGIKQLSTLTPPMLRTTEDLRDKTKEELRGIISEVIVKNANRKPNEIHRIEYSMDGGFSWQQLALPQQSLEANVANVYRIANATRGYVVRTLDVIDNRQPAKTFQQFTNQPTQIKSNNVYVRRSETGEYSWEATSHLFGTTDRIVVIQIEVPFKMVMPNTNKIIWNKWTGDCDGWPKTGIPLEEESKAANMGHVYEIHPSSAFKGGITALIASEAARKLGFNFDDWMVVIGARVYDDESEVIFGRFDKITALSDKYIVTNTQKHKLGSQFFVRARDIWDIYAAGNAIGAYINIATGPAAHHLGITNVNIEMKGYQQFLEELLASGGTPQDIADAIAMSIDLRDKTVDNIKQLNSSIMKAKERLQTLLETNSSNQSNSTSS